MDGGWKYTHAPRWRIVTPLRIILVGLLAAVVVIGVLGGWRRDERSRADTPTIQPGETISGLPFAITPKRAEWTTSTEEPFFTQEGERLIVLVLELETMADFPVHANTLSDELITDIRSSEGTEFLPGFFKRTARSAYRTIDLRTSAALPPELPQEIGFVFTQPTSTPLPEEVTVLLPNLTWREHSGGIGYSWFDPVVRAQVTLPLERMADP